MIFFPRSEEAIPRKPTPRSEYACHGHRPKIPVQTAVPAAEPAALPDQEALEPIAVPEQDSVPVEPEYRPFPKSAKEPEPVKNPEQESEPDREPQPEQDAREEPQEGP